MKSFTACVALFALLAVCTQAAVTEWGYPEEENVIVLTDAIFDEVLAKHDFILVEFYAPWCGHCKKLAPEYSKAAQALKQLDQAIPLAKVDATAETGLANKFQIQGFPTLKLFIKGKDIEYTGGRTESEIVSWIQKKTGPTSAELKNAGDLETFRKQRVGVVFFGEQGSAQHQTFLTVSAGFDDVAFGHTFDGALATEHGAPTNGIVIFKQFDEGKVVYTGAFESTPITEFIRANQFPVVIEIDQASAQKVFGEGRDVLIVFVKTTSDPAIDQLRATESALKGKILLTYVTFADFGKRVADYLGVTDAEAPTYRIIRQAGDMLKYKPTAPEVTTENLIAFYEGVSSGALTPFYKSEDIPASNDEPVKVLVSKSWKDIVEDETKDVLVEFYAPWCGHCKALAPVYDKVAEKLIAQGASNVVIAKMDATANEVAGQAIQGFPTLRFFPSNNKRRPIEFKGDRTEDGILSFIREHATVSLTGEQAKTDL